MMLEETALHTVIKIRVFAKYKACVESRSLLQGTQLRQVGVQVHGILDFWKQIFPNDTS